MNIKLVQYDTIIIHHRYFCELKILTFGHILSCSIWKALLHPHWQVIQGWDQQASKLHSSAPLQSLARDSTSQITFLGDLKGLRLVGAKSICRLPHWNRLYYWSSTIGMKHFSFEYHFWRLVGKLNREAQSSFIKSSFKGSILRSLETNSPFEEIFIFKSNRNRKIWLTFLGNYIKEGLRSYCFLIWSIAILRSPPCMIIKIVYKFEWT